MTKKKKIDDFLAEKNLAVFGASRSGKKFGNVLYRAMRERGYAVFAVHPDAKTIEGDRCWRSVEELPSTVRAAVLCVPPAQSEAIVSQLGAGGFERVWMQQGSESAAAVESCQAHGIDCVFAECLLMFAEPVAFPHSLHRGLRRLFGRLPS